MGTGARMATITGTAMTDPLHILAQWFSPAFPVSAYAWSHGLEWAISAGDITDAVTLQAWLEAILRHGSGRNDAILMKLAFDAPDPEPIAELARAFAFGRERLAETEAQGAAFTDAVNALYGLALPQMPYPVAIGTAARALDLPLRPTIRYALHAFTANLTGAAMRFMPMGQSDGQRVLADLFALIDTVAEEARGADEADLGGSAIRADLAALQHETLPTRIFRS